MITLFDDCFLESPPTPDSLTMTPENTFNRNIVIIAILVITAVIILIIAFICCVVHKCKKKKKERKDRQFPTVTSGSEDTTFSLSTAKTSGIRNQKYWRN